MSTNDVPGFDAINNDELAMGCWAEHEDGSLIFVESVENGRVVFEMFDTSIEPIVSYRSAMLEDQFKRQFSFEPKGTSNIQWVWHDKTPFPWDIVIKKGLGDGVRVTSGDEQVSAAMRVARSMKLRGITMENDDFERVERKRKRMAEAVEMVGRKGRIIIDKIQRAIGELRR